MLGQQIKLRTTETAAAAIEKFFLFSFTKTCDLWWRLFRLSRFRPCLEAAIDLMMGLMDAAKRWIGKRSFCFGSRSRTTIISQIKKSFSLSYSAFQSSLIKRGLLTQNIVKPQKRVTSQATKNPRQDYHHPTSPTGYNNIITPFCMFFYTVNCNNFKHKRELWICNWIWYGCLGLQRQSRS